jgi:two-component system, sensor histidine kinase PdtaS
MPPLKIFGQNHFFESKLLAKLLISMGIILCSFSTVSKAQVYSKNDLEKFEYCNQLEKEGIAQKKPAKVADAFYIRGKIKAAYFEIEESNSWLVKALRIQEKVWDFKGMAKSYREMSKNASHIGQSKQYFSILNELEQLNKNYPNSTKEVDFNVLKGHFYATTWADNPRYAKPNFDSALYYFQKAIPKLIPKSKSDSEAYSSNYYQVAVLKLLLKKPDALKKLLIAEKFRPDSSVHLLQIYLSQADYYFANNKLTEASITVNKAIKLQNKLNNLDNELKRHFHSVMILYWTYIDKRPEIAAQNQYLVNQMNEQIAFADRNGAVSKLYIQFETQKKEAQLAQQKLEISLKNQNLKTQQRFIWLVSSLVVIMAFLSYFLYKLFRKNKEIANKNTILLQEQNHRVKNNLQVISSLLSLQSNLLEEGKAKEAVDESQLRIEAMTILHRQLYNKQDALEKIDMEAYIPELTEVIIQSYGQNVETNYNIQQKSLNADKAVLIALVINELVTNACKYAFSKNEKSELFVSLLEKGKDVELIVKDNGSKKIEVFSENISSQKNSFGLKLINMMAYELNGIFSYKYEEGSSFSLVFSEI